MGRPISNRVCSVSGCGRKHKANGFCHKHNCNNKYKIDPKERKRHENYRKNNPEKVMVFNAHKRAKKLNLEFNISVDDIFIPKYCPILGIELKPGVQKSIFNSPSLDRIDNSKGYVKGNVRVISWRANDLKKNGTLQEFECIVKDFKNLCNL